MYCFALRNCQESEVEGTLEELFINVVKVFLTGYKRLFIQTTTEISSVIERVPSWFKIDCGKTN